MTPRSRPPDRDAPRLRVVPEQAEHSRADGQPVRRAAGTPRTGAGRTGTPRRTGPGGAADHTARADTTSEDTVRGGATRSGTRAGGTRGTAARAGTPRGAGTSRGGGTSRSGTARGGTPRSGTARSGGGRTTPRTGGGRGGGPPRSTAPRRTGPYGRPARRPVRLGDPRSRLRVSAVLFAVLLLIVAGRLVWLQGFQSKTYAAKAESQRLRVAPLPATRGSITDRNGQIFAEDVDARDVYGDPSQVTDKAGTATKLAKLLELPAPTLQAELSRPGRYAKLAVGITPELGGQIVKLDLPGIALVDTQHRIYPSHTLAAGVIGYTTLDADERAIGKGGIEGKYDAALRGRDGKERVEEDPSGRAIPLGVHHEVEPVAGTDVQLTLDRDIQWQAQTAITKTVHDTKAVSGTVIVQDPRTGEVLAMASAPSFDPNQLKKGDPFGNAATGSVYEPGSVNKVITMAAGIDAGVISPTSPVTVPPTLPVTSSYTLHDDEVHGTEHLTAAGVLAKSSNIGTVEIARKLGTGRLMRALHAFGLGSETAVHFPGESEGLLPPAPWGITTATTIPFGQGMSATALQMSTVYATIANGGVKVEPKLVKATVDANGVAHPTAASPAKRVVSAATASAVSRMLEAVVSKNGTAPLAQIDGYRVAGKTGTANRVVNGRYNGYTASFVGFAPADKPKLVVEVVLDGPQAGHYGGAVAAPVFQQVMSFALQSLRIPPTGTAPAPIPLETT